MRDQPTPRPTPPSHRLHLTEHLPPTVITLGVVSFFTDLSSEMIYPLLPVFLGVVLGAGPLALGFIEGVAESTAALLKLVSGRLSDRSGRRKPWVVAGYGLASVARPLIGMAGSWGVVLGLRFADRVGKGLRAAPRDALIAEVTPPDRHGEAFGFQRALDHAGAVLGPLLAAALLSLAGVSLREIFLLAAVPGVVVMALVLASVREAPVRSGVPTTPLAFPLRQLGRPLLWFLAAVVVFTLGNSTDAFLLLRLAEAGTAPAGVAVVWSLIHVVKMITSYLGGRLSDRLGRRPMVLVGWAWYGAIYLAFAFLKDPTLLIAVFLAYGVYYGLTEPVEKAWVAELAPPQLKGTAFGAYNGAVGLAALPASLLFGYLWSSHGAHAAFLTGAALAGAAAGMLLLGPPARNSTTP